MEILHGIGLAGLLLCLGLGVVVLVLTTPAVVGGTANAVTATLFRIGLSGAGMGATGFVKERHDHPDSNGRVRRVWRRVRHR